LSKAIIVAAKLGGGDPDANIRLRTAIIDAKAVSMPRDNIERAIKKGTGEIEGNDVEEILYEGYGPGGVAVLCDIMTDNRNRTASEIRKIFDVHGGKLGSTNCVAYLFERKGLVSLEKSKASLDQTMELALEAGADDVVEQGDNLEVTCAPENFASIVEAFENAKIDLAVKEVTRIPTSTVEVDSDTAKTIVKLLELLDDHDDVQSVSSNVSFSEEQLEAFSA
jgi:YebC/PmpR family DNA-binding regulatory protein